MTITNFFVFRKDIADVIPSCISGTLRAQQWVVLVQDHYKTINNLTPDECRKKYLGMAGSEERKQQEMTGEDTGGKERAKKAGQDRT